MLTPLGPREGRGPGFIIGKVRGGAAREEKLHHLYGIVRAPTSGVTGTRHRALRCWRRQQEGRLPVRRRHPSYPVYDRRGEAASDVASS